MIISQTPFRLSFAGGGTDLPAFYSREYGAVLSTALKRHMYVTIHRRFEDSIRVSYSRTEVVLSVADVAHELVREAMRLTGTTAPLEVTTIADTPAGTGLGSSSSLVVGLLNAMHAYAGRVTSRASLASQACKIEIEVLGHPIGRQDQYAAAYGGLNYITFHPDGTVDVAPVPCSTAYRRMLEDHSLLAYTDTQRSAREVLTQQSKGTSQKQDVLRAMRDLAARLRDAISGEARPETFGGLLHDGWLLKRSLGFGISTDLVDRWYPAALGAGAFGGKLLGAGGGGFLYLFAPPDRHRHILGALGNPKVMPVEFDPLGSRIAFMSD